MSDPVVVWHEHSVSREDRERLNGHAGCVVWFTGLSGCGKSTIANALERKLWQENRHTYLLDGDNVRHGLNATPQLLAERFGQQHAERFGLGFGATDRVENIRRVGAVAKMMCDAGLITLTAFVSPYRDDRDAVRGQIDAGSFVEVFVDAPLEVCESRDPKGLYKKARAGEIKDFTGISAPYEPPVAPELVLENSGERTPDALAEEVLQYLASKGKIPPRT
ncbi:MAG: adenylyl-sulfate kinase [Planctomycetales bacterium]|nr:adenylyl-sulfate kinase [Planctomycetales bacterium]